MCSANFNPEQNGTEITLNRLDFMDFIREFINQGNGILITSCNENFIRIENVIRRFPQHGKNERIKQPTLFGLSCLGNVSPWTIISFLLIQVFIFHLRHRWQMFPNNNIKCATTIMDIHANCRELTWMPSFFKGVMLSQFEEALHHHCLTRKFCLPVFVLLL